jgi:hypothetical protein
VAAFPLGNSGGLPAGLSGFTNIKNTGNAGSLSGGVFNRRTRLEVSKCFSGLPPESTSI